MVVLLVSLVGCGVGIVVATVALLQFARLALFVSCVVVDSIVTVSMPRGVGGAATADGHVRHELKLRNQFSVLDDYTTTTSGSAALSPASDAGASVTSTRSPVYPMNDTIADSTKQEPPLRVSAQQNALQSSSSTTTTTKTTTKKLDSNDILALYGDGYENAMVMGGGGNGAVQKAVQPMGVPASPLRPKSQPPPNTVGERQAVAPFLKMSDAALEITLRAEDWEMPTCEEKENTAMGDAVLDNELLQLAPTEALQNTHVGGAGTKHVVAAPAAALSSRYAATAAADEDDFSGSGDERADAKARGPVYVYCGGEDHEGDLGGAPRPVPTVEAMHDDEPELSPELVVAMKRRQAVGGIQLVLQEALDELESRTHQVRAYIVFAVNARSALLSSLSL